MFLITTADLRFWKTDERILFLGEWCKLFSQRSVWEKLTYEVLPYHWDNRKKLYQDYLYLDKLYEQKLLEMTNLLNQIHETDHSPLYWRIIIGPWLFYFVQVLYDRYQSILTAIESGRVTKTLIPKYEEAKWIPSDFPHLLEWLISDNYNQYMYSRIIEFTDKIPFDIVRMKDGNSHRKQDGSIKRLFSPKKIIKKFIWRYGKFIPDRLNQIVLVSSYLSITDLIKLQLSLKQIPYIMPSSVVSPETDIDPTTREKLSINSLDNEFEQLLGIMIKEQIPSIYVEGYTQMNECSLKAYPRKPKIIFNANAYFSNEAFKFWAAHHVDLGVKFLGTQHGGHYGTGLWSSIESHQIKISDQFYTWGWKHKLYKNTKPLAAAKLNKVIKNVRPKKDGRILLVLTTVPRYSYHMYSIPVASTGMLAYFDDQYRFAGTLSEENQKLLLVRLYHSDYGWDQMERWNNKFPDIECYVGRQSMLKQLSESRLFVGTYNATTYLETFAANFPTILFWNPDHWELRPSAQPYFDELRRVGILHETPESAAALINDISHDLTSWWQQAEIQEVKNQFCRQVARTSDKWMNEWKEELLSLANTSNF